MDIGCGGGILAEPLARLGASVVGIDAVKENISTAQYHTDPSLKTNLKYEHGLSTHIRLERSTSEFSLV